MSIRRLSVLLAVPIMVAATLLASQAAAEDGCRVTASGVECSFTGGGEIIVENPGTTLPPLRWLQTTTASAVGECWFWSRYPPGIDSWDPLAEQRIIAVVAALPPCPDGSSGDTSGGDDDIAAFAWEVFRLFRLDRPRPLIEPVVGITNLASYASAPIPGRIDHDERLPDGSRLQVRAEVRHVWVRWGDGSPPHRYRPDRFLPYPDGAATRVYGLKTCGFRYRRDHPSGRNCHPTLDAYPIEVTFTWEAGYRHDGGPWIVLGTIDRRRTIDYDVDEVVGVPDP